MVGGAWGWMQAGQERNMKPGENEEGNNYRLREMDRV